jgi:hypothetical protein
MPRGCFLCISGLIGEAPARLIVSRSIPMRSAIRILLLLFGCSLQASRANTNLVAIYLLDMPLHQPWHQLDDAHLKEWNPISPPVLADDDFLAIDTTNQSFVVTGAAAKRLALGIWSLSHKDAPGWGPVVFRTGEFALIPRPAPFVLHAGGEPIYAGVFFTSVSSASFAGPVIMAEEMFIKTNVPENARFSFSIKLGYPGEFPGTPEPRWDSRITSAVQKLFAKKR